jgi:hypothetical protein
MERTVALDEHHFSMDGTLRAHDRRAEVEAETMDSDEPRINTSHGVAVTLHWMWPVAGAASKGVTMVVADGNKDVINRP